MKVCIITNDFPPISAGISIFIGGLYEGFTTLGHDTFVLFSPINSTFSSSDTSIVLQPIYGSRNFQRILSSRAVINKYSKQIFQSDLVIFSTWSPMAIAFFPFFSKKGPKSVLFAHGNDILGPANSFIYKMLMKRVFQRFDYVVTNSRFTAELCYRVTKKKASPVGGGLDKKFLVEPRICDSGNSKSKPFTMLSVGRLVRRKGFDTVIRSLEKIRNDIGDWKYVIIGNGPFKNDLENVILHSKLEGNVQIFDQIESKDLLRWYKQADIFIMTSREIPEEGEVEGLGLVYMEAGSARLPVIAGLSGGVGDVVKDRVNGLLVDPSSLTEISQAIARLYHDRDLREELGKNGRRLAETEWRWDRIAQKIIEIAYPNSVEVR